MASLALLSHVGRLMDLCFMRVSPVFEVFQTIRARGSRYALERYGALLSASPLNYRISPNHPARVYSGFRTGANPDQSGAGSPLPERGGKFLRDHIGIDEFGAMGKVGEEFLREGCFAGPVRPCDRVQMRHGLILAFGYSFERMGYIAQNYLYMI